MNKPFQLGITVGRFQTFHNGHKDMLDRALALCDRVGVLIGSSQESGTNNNPFSYELREELLRRVYGDRIEIVPLPDIGVGNNATWGEYVLDNVIRRFGTLPDLFVSGKEARRIEWFDGVNGLSIAELYIPKTIDISAARMRELIVDNDFDTWKSYCDERLWDAFPRLREIVLASRDNGDTASL